MSGEPTRSSALPPSRSFVLALAVAAVALACGGGTPGSSPDSGTPSASIDAPTQVAAQVSHCALQVSWQPPAQATASTQYTVTASPGGASQTTAQTQATFWGLTPGVGYTFAVTAQDGTARSPASAASAATALPSPQSLAVHPLKPDLFLVVDKSGSMNNPIDPSLAACQLSDGGTCGTAPAPSCPSGCPTRWSTVSGALDAALSDAGTAARWGLTMFPEASVCGGSTDVTVALNSSEDDPASMQSTADQIASQIGAAAPNGGTPTSASLSFLQTAYAAAPAAHRANFALLLTDGVPNCNPNNPNAGSVSTCQCTDSAATCAAAQTPSGGILYPQFCLDEDATLQALRGLSAAGVRTAVVGVGAETADGGGAQVLDAMAQAGQFPCTLDDGGTCAVHAYASTTGAQLGAALESVTHEVARTDPCTLAVSPAPSSVQDLLVEVNGAGVAMGPDTWTYDSGILILQGALCASVRAASSSAPVTVSAGACP